MSAETEAIFGDRLIKEKSDIKPDVRDEKGNQVVGDKEEKVEQKVDKKPEEKIVDTKVEEKIVEKPEVQQVNWLDEFNKTFEKEYKEDDIKALFDKVGKYDEIETSNKDLNQKLTEYMNLAKKVNPLEHFASEDEYIRNQFLKSNKDKYSGEVLDTLSSLSPDRISKLSPEDAIKTNLMVNKGLSGEEAEAYVNDMYGIEEGEELSVAASAKMKVDARDAVSSLTELYKGIDIPEKVDWESTRTQLKDSWRSPLSETIKGIDKIAIAEGVDFIVDDAMKQGLEDEIMSELLSNGIKPTEDTLKEIVGLSKDRLILRNMDKVVSSMESDLREKIKSELRAEIHNDKPLNNESRTTAQTSRTADDVVSRFID